MSFYTEQYYKTGNYANYLNKQERYDKLAEDIYDLFKKIKFIDSDKCYSWLDYGSGPGLFVKSLSKLLKNVDVYAFDISDWCMQQLKNSQFNIAKLSLNENYHIISFLDVLEHMSDNEIENLLKKIHGNKLLIRIPVASEESILKSKFHLVISNLDKTHINCKTKKSWIEFFNKIGYRIMFKVNLSSIYDSEGVLCAILEKI